MENTLIRQNPHWGGALFQNVYPRAALSSILNKKELPHIQIFTGIRRCGKSTMFHLLINDLMEQVNPKEILIISMDDPNYTIVWNNVNELYRIIETAEKTTSCKIKYLFVDEIQHVKNWELFVKSAYDCGAFKKIYITGSNSNLLGNEFSALLSGRYFSDEIRPFSLSEIMDFKGIADKYYAIAHKAELLNLMDEVLERGCFPEIVVKPMTEEICMELLRNYYESVVLKDCIMLNGIRDTHTFYQLLHYVLTNVGSCYTYSSLAKAVNSNENSIRTFLSCLQESYITSDITNFSFSPKTSTRPQHKSYCIDNGLMFATTNRFSPKSGTALENLMYNELVNNRYENICFGSRDGECDFIAQKEGGIHAFQVCYNLTSENTPREIKGFSALGDKVKFDSKTIITYNQQEIIGDINVIPIWMFFCFNK